MYAVALNGMENPPRSSHNPHAQTKPIDVPCRGAARASSPNTAEEYGCPGNNHGFAMIPPAGSPSPYTDDRYYTQFPGHGYLSNSHD
jgi:hypothetical protein